MFNPIMSVLIRLWRGFQWVTAVCIVFLAVSSLWHGAILSSLLLTVSAIVVAPLSRRWIQKVSYKDFSRKYSIVIAVVLFFVALVVNPGSQADRDDATQALLTGSESLVIDSESSAADIEKIPKKEIQIERIKKQPDQSYDVEGYGPPEEEVSVELANDLRYTARTNGDGWFVVVLPANTTPFGTLQLQAQTDTGYESIHPVYYYSFFAEQPIISSTRLSPVVTQVIESDSGMVIEGFSEPKTKIIMTHNGIELAETDVNTDGYFVFRNVDKKDHFMHILFANKERSELVIATYVDTTVHTLNSTLPRWTKEIMSTESVAYTTRESLDSSLPSGQTRVSQEGKEGSKTVYYTVTYVGGDEVERAVAREVLQVSPIERIIVVGTYLAPSPKHYSAPVPAPVPTSAYYKNCTEARAAGVAPIYRGQPGYGKHLDRDGDGIACE